jgi:5-methylcytosine-specific restriction enzyme subunit McrC
VIGIRNLYALLAFSMRDLNLVSDQEVGACQFDKPYEVLAILLERALNRAFRRGIDRQYQTLEDTGPRLRGTLNTARTIRGMLHLRGQLAFDTDELLRDTPANRLLKAALRELRGRKDVPTKYRRKLALYLSELAEVREVAKRGALRSLGGVRGPRGNAPYATALLLSKLVLAQQLVDAGGEESTLRGVLRDEHNLPLLYEGFVRGFSSHILGSGYRVRAKQPGWPVAEQSAEAAERMPQMRTDVHIQRASEGGETSGVGIIECKYYESPLSSGPHSQTPKWNSAHLYQLMAYLHADAAESPQRPPSRTRGLLAYAHHEISFDETFTLHGFPFRMATINLELPWPVLRARVEDLVRWSAPVQCASAARGAA